MLSHHNYPLEFSLHKSTSWSSEIGEDHLARFGIPETTFRTMVPVSSVLNLSIFWTAMG
jgi:hypothetical protein